MKALAIFYKKIIAYVCLITCFIICSIFITSCGNNTNLSVKEVKAVLNKLESIKTSINTDNIASAIKEEGFTDQQICGMTQHDGGASCYTKGAAEIFLWTYPKRNSYYEKQGISTSQLLDERYSDDYLRRKDEHIDILKKNKKDNNALNRLKYSFLKVIDENTYLYSYCEQIKNNTSKQEGTSYAYYRIITIKVKPNVLLTYQYSENNKDGTEKYFYNFTTQAKDDIELLNHILND